MIEFFEVISTSTPHIYHSALLLSPKTSIVLNLHKPQTSPLVRVIHGVPTSWDSCIANKRVPHPLEDATWSPCGKFIAISQHSEIEILDSATLGKLYTLSSKSEDCSVLHPVFSPDGHLLTGYSRKTQPSDVVSWDFQTGGLISHFHDEGDLGYCHSISHSRCGNMLGVLYGEDGVWTIIIYNVLSGSQITSQLVKEPVTGAIWTQGECIQFTNLEPGLITIWELGFTSSHIPTQAGTLPIPDNFPSRQFLPREVSRSPTPDDFSWRDVFLAAAEKRASGDSASEEPPPENLLLSLAISRISFTLEGRVLVWDTHHHKILLDSGDVKDPQSMMFSPDGLLFICGGSSQEFCLWKGSPNGYILHQKLTSTAEYPRHIFSPNGESFVGFSLTAIQQWHTAKNPNSLSSISAQAFQYTSHGSILGFSQTGELAVVAHQSDGTVTVFDLKSGNPRLAVDTGINIVAAGITETTAAVISCDKIITWDLSAGDRAFSTGVNSCSKSWTTMIPGTFSDAIGISISPDLSYFAVTEHDKGLHLHDVSTGKHLTSVRSDGFMPVFTPDGNTIWCDRMSEDTLDVWKIVKGGKANTIKLEFLGLSTDPPGGFPWQSSHDYQVTDDAWILNSSGKRLLWLPNHWQINQVWNGKFLGLFHRKLPDVAILELEV